VITTADLPLHVAGFKPEAKGEDAIFIERVEAFEKVLIFEALDKAGGVQTRAAVALGMSERYFCYKLKKYGTF
jgi:DNA-binding NtrC family response regulator